MDVTQFFILFGAILITIAVNCMLDSSKKNFRKSNGLCLSCGGSRRAGFNPNSQRAVDVLCPTCCNEWVCYLMSL